MHSSSSTGTILSNFDSLHVWQGLESKPSSTGSLPQPSESLPAIDESDFDTTIHNEMAMIRQEILEKHQPIFRQFLKLRYEEIDKKRRREWIEFLIKNYKIFDGEDFVKVDAVKCYFKCEEQLASSRKRLVGSMLHLNELLSAWEKLHSRESRNCSKRFIKIEILKKWENLLFHSPESLSIKNSRFYFLCERHEYLDNIRTKFAEAMNEEKAHFKLPPSLDAGKKLADTLDDIYSFFRGDSTSVTLNLIGPIIVGATGGIIHFFEGLEGIKMAYDAFKDEKMLGRKAKIVAGTGIFALTGAGFGLSVSYLASIAGATVAGAAIMPFLIPALLTGVYFVAQGRRLAVRNECKEKYEAAQKNPADLEEEIKKDTPLTQECINRLVQYEANKAAAKAKYDDAKRAVNFGYVEVAASCTTAIGTALSMSAIVGASAILTLGILPMVLLAIGVGVGITSKLYEQNQAWVNSTASEAYQWLKRSVKGIGGWIYEKCFAKTNALLPAPPAPTPVAIPPIAIIPAVRVSAAMGEQPMKSSGKRFFGPAPAKLPNPPKDIPENHARACP